MSHFTRSDALLMAATEALPAEWRDLSDLLEMLAHEGVTLDEAFAGASRHRLASHLARNVTPRQVETWLQRLETLASEIPDVWLTEVTKPTYPELLRDAYFRPPFLFVRGTLTEVDRHAVAIVGSRSADQEALEASHALGKACAAAGVTVISGLARGVDGAAHRGALDAGGRTIGVLGHGIDDIYPPEHGDLARSMTRQGAVVSQFRPGSPGTRSSFPMRNTVIAGLARISVIMAAEERSGTRSEAEAARSIGRHVAFWQPCMSRSAWAEDWIRDGAASWVSSADEVLAQGIEPTTT